MTHGGAGGHGGGHYGGGHHGGGHHHDGRGGDFVPAGRRGGRGRPGPGRLLFALVFAVAVCLLVLALAR